MPETKSAFGNEGESEGDRYRRTDLTNEVGRSPDIRQMLNCVLVMLVAGVTRAISGGRSARDPVRRGRTAINLKDAAK
jgi:hypothetical protein